MCLLDSDKNTTCFKVKLRIEPDVLERPKDISWTLGTCSNDRVYHPLDGDDYDQQCCLATGTHDLLCKESTGIGWTFGGGSLRAIEKGYIAVGVTKYCETFTGDKIPPRFAMANKVHVLGK